MKVTLVNDVVELGKRIDGVKATGAKLDREIHTLALSALAQLGEHGNTNFVNRLYVSMPAGSRRQALTSWFLAYGSLVANDDKKTKKEQPFRFSKDKTTNIDGGMADPWFDHSKDKDPDQVFDLQEALANLISRAQAASKKGKLGHGELLDKLIGAKAAVTAPASTEPAPQ